MREEWIPRLRCPVTGASYDVDVTRGGPGEVVEGFLVARERREVRLVLGGIGVLPRDLVAHLRTYGAVYARLPLSDSRIGRFVLGRTGQRGHDSVPFDEVVRRYADLLPPDALPEPALLAEEDSALARVLSACSPEVEAALDVGSGVGRGVFVLLGFARLALGVDRSLARVRRGRNIAATPEDFLLPVARGSRVEQVPLELSRLARAGADFAVADAGSLPLAGASVDVVVLRRGDGLGPFPDPALALREAERVLAPGGLLVLEGETAPSGAGWTSLDSAGAFRAWRRP